MLINQIAAMFDGIVLLLINLITQSINSFFIFCFIEILTPLHLLNQKIRRHGCIIFRLNFNPMHLT